MSGGDIRLVMAAIAGIAWSLLETMILVAGLAMVIGLSYIV